MATLNLEKTHFHKLLTDIKARYVPAKPDVEDLLENAYARPILYADWNPVYRCISCSEFLRDGRAKCNYCTAEPAYIHHFASIGTHSDWTRL